ncbi:MAG: carbohydrate kinase [Hyphomicrobiales bacterium]|nr:carbohydrate kinase [Hyphomicrobiales bacterium]
MSGRILSMGEALVDVLPAADGLWRPVAGGSSYNVARGLGRFGASCGFVGRLSRDGQGELMAGLLAAEGVTLDLCARDDRPSPLSLVAPGTQTTSARFAIYLDGTAHAPPDLPKNWLSGAAHLHVSSFSAISAAWGKAVLAALEDARGRISASLDLNVRPALIPAREEARRALEKRIALVDIVKASDEDLTWLFPDRDPADAAREWAIRFGALVLLTRGPAGATAFLGAETIDSPGRAVTVVDTVGAGDCFVAAFLSQAITRGRFGPEAGTAGQLRTWLNFANAAAALCCARVGSNPPTRAESEAFAQSF